MIELLMKQEIPLRTIVAAMAATLFLCVTASYLYFFKKPLAEYSRLNQSRILLQAKTENKARVTEDIENLKKEIEDLRHVLHGDTPPMAVNTLVAYAIEKLDAISARHGVRFSSVKPGAARTMYMFEEVPFSVKVSGDYFSLYEWLFGVEKELGPMVIKRFAIKPEGRTKELGMELEIASYRPGGKI